MVSWRILVIDDDDAVRRILNDYLIEEGHDVVCCSNALCGLEEYKRAGFDVVLSDIRMKGMDGLTFLTEIKKIDPEAKVIMITAYGTVENAVDAMKSGAFDYIKKPFRLDDIHFSIKKALNFKKLERENISLKKELKKKYSFEHIIGESPPMQKVFERIAKVADSDSTILIFGESGTGKELVAKTIHYQSQRASRPLIPVNCGAIPDSLLESELFGHEKGAFTGAIATRIGRFELADGGTIFLDEVTELSRPLQVKLLRVIQEREFERVGGIKTIHVNVRIVSATNKKIEEAVEKGEFRDDLYYRLNVIPLEIPPLRERRDDIELLCNHFLNVYCKKKQRSMMRIDSEVMKIMKKYPWPGNVRELENLIERIVVLKDKNERIITKADLPERFFNREDEINFTISDDGIDLGKAVEDFEKRLIVQALKKSHGVKSKAANLLKVNRTTLVEKIKRLDCAH
jgi:two-component system response regulator AtoC